MKAITVQQPWAWAIIHGGKDIENRTRIGTWRPARDSRIAIHAGQRWSDRGAGSQLVIDAYARVARLPFGLRPIADDIEFDLGAIIGTVRVVDVHPTEECCQPWGESSYRQADGTLRQGYLDIAHLVLADPRPCEPIPCRGALGLWTVPDDIAARLA
jgi:hypothetical protein